MAASFIRSSGPSLKFIGVDMLLFAVIVVAPPSALVVG